MMDLNRAYLFIKIVEAGNISKAAQNLNMPKAKLSRNLALLEEELKTQLVYRTTRQFKLTETGIIFFENIKSHMDAIINSTSHLENEAEQISGTLKITAPDDLGMLIITNIANEFCQSYPKINFELIYTNDVLDLVKLGVDVAIRIGNLKDSTLIHKKAGTVDLILAASPKYLSKFSPINDVEDILKHQTVGFTFEKDWTLINKNKKKTLKLHHKYIANNFIAVRDLVLNGHGVGYLPKFLCQEEINSGHLVHILKSWGDEGAPIQVIIPHQKKISKKVRAFMDFSAKKLSEIF